MRNPSTLSARLGAPVLGPALVLVLTVGCAAPRHPVSDDVSYAFDAAAPAVAPAVTPTGALDAAPEPTEARPAPPWSVDALAYEPVTTPSSSPLLVQRSAAPKPSRKPRWRERTTVLQGYLGATLVDDLERTDGSGSTEGDISSLPVIGGGAQLKLGGERIDWGVEGMLAFNWRANGTAFSTGGGGATVAVSINLLLLELYGGAFASVFLNDDWRLYGAIGPSISFADYDEESDTTDSSGTGFGVGGYARTGLEYRWSDSTMIGIGARYLDQDIDLSGGLGDLSLTGTQVFLTVTQGF